MELTDTALRDINTQLLNVVAQPPPRVVLATVAALLDGLDDVRVAPDVEWGDGFTRWEVVAVSRDSFAYVEASKRAEDWFGGGAPDQDDETVKCTGSVWPLEQISSLTFTSASVTRFEGGWAGQQVFGTWTVRLPTRTVEIETNSRRYASARDTVVRELRSRWRAVAPGHLLD